MLQKSPNTSRKRGRNFRSLRSLQLRRLRLALDQENQ